MIRALEDAGGGRIRDAATKDLVSSREVVDDYNVMRLALSGICRQLCAIQRVLDPLAIAVGEESAR